MEGVAETHCHTCACDHAFSTLYENVRYAAAIGMPFLCITEHAPAMTDGPHEWFFRNLPKVVPERLDGVVVLRGAEANIMDYDGGLDLSARSLEQLDWVIASYHTVCIQPSTVEDHTRGWLAIAENPLVDVIGHCGDARYPFDMDTVMRAFARNGKIVEINAHSFSARPGSRERCREVALACKRQGVRIVCSSDAHFFTEIGQVGPALEMLREIAFPEELVLNTDYDRFLAVAREKSGRRLIETESER